MGLIPPNEAARLQALKRYDILDTPPDGSFDRITAIAARLFGVPIAIVSLVDHDRIWFKSRHGLDVDQIGREPGLCASAILEDRPWIIEDAKADPRALANPLVAGEFGLRFYAGAQLRTRDGFNLGTLCVIDRQPRKVSAEDERTLADLAAIVVDEMELRLAARLAVEQKDLEIEQRKRAQEQERFLTQELKHRVKNTLASVRAIANLSGRNSSSVKEFIEKFDGRLSMLVSAQDMLAAKGHASADLRTLLTEVLAPFDNDVEGNVTFAGAPVLLQQRCAMALALVLHEFSTNAAKYGALSTSSGRLAVDWRIESREPSPSLILRWKESGGPAIEREPDREGFGSKMLRYAVQYELQGRYSLDFLPQGLEAELAIPVEGNLERSMQESELGEAEPISMTSR